MEPIFVGQIMPFGGLFAPKNWMMCNGQILKISEYHDLYTLLGTNYGGDGKTTFGLPDLRARVPIGVGRGPGLSYFPLGQKGGAEDITLNKDNIAPHSHAITGTLNFRNDAANESIPFDGSFARTTAQIYSADGPTLGDNLYQESITATAAAAGAEAPAPFTNRDPYQACVYIIALTGVMPEMP